MNKKLTRKELVEYIKQIVPKDLNETEKLAFIEREVAKQISFDEKYLWGDIETKRKIYKIAQKDAQNSVPQINKKLICVTMAELFGYVAKQFGYDVLYQKRAPGQEIKAGENEIFKSISLQKLEHVCPLVGLSNGKYIEVDIQDDMARLQTNSRPKAFGANRHGTGISNGVAIDVLPQYNVNDVFRKIYGLKEREMFTDEYIITKARTYRYENKSPIEMLEAFMEEPAVKKQFQNMRCIEANKFYKLILMACYGFSDGKQFVKDENHAIIEECILSENEGKKRYSFCIYAEDNKQKVFYVYSKKSKRMIKLTQEEIKQMTSQVMNVELKGKPSPIKDNMMKFVEGENKERENLSPQNNEISLEDIFLEEDEEEL